MVFNPIPFVDATAAWAFRERWRRILVGSGGMMVELFLASIAAVVWVQTGDGLLHSVAYNVMFVASVSTLILNINPLMRFDGYYILSDLTDTPNLHQRAARQFFYVCEKYIYGNQDGTPVAENRKESFWLSVFAVAGWIYRVFIFSAILWFVADRFFGLGFIAAMIGLVTFIFVPIVKHIRYLTSDSRIEQFRARAIAVSSTVSIGLIGFLGFVPMPHAFFTDGIITTTEHRDVYARVEGLIPGGILPSHQPVEKGTQIFASENEELLLHLKRTEAQLSQVKTLEQMSMVRPEMMIPVTKRREAIEGQIQKLREDLANLQYKAPMDGIWVAPESTNIQNVWVHRGSKVGMIMDPADYSLSAVVKQRHAQHLFNHSIRGATIRIPGQSEHQLTLSDLKFIEGEQHILPHAGLGWGGGGDIEVKNDGKGLQAIEPFFLVQADIEKPESSDNLTLLHDQRARVRFALPNTPYMVQWFTLLRQLVQERFEI
jgi:putative peptide zinc metalloprotease protein